MANSQQLKANNSMMLIKKPLHLAYGKALYLVGKFGYGNAHYGMAAFHFPKDTRKFTYYSIANWYFTLLARHAFGLDRIPME
jgi:hypothetical protein